MALDPTDPRPAGISLKRAYTAIRDWYRSAIQSVEGRQDDYGRASAALIRALPRASELSVLELKAVFTEVIYGYLEWGYHESDGRFKMGAHAHAALDAAGFSYDLTEHERARLGTSPLWPLFFFNRGQTAHESEDPGGSIVMGECHAANCPLRDRALGGRRTDTPIILEFMTVGGGHDRPPKGQFLDLVRRVHKGAQVREVILTDPYIYSDVGEDDTTGGYGNLLEYLQALNLRRDSEFVLRLNPMARRGGEAAKARLERTVKDAFPRARLETFSGDSRFHDRFYLVRDGAGRFTGIFGPSLNGLDSDSVVLMGELEHARALERLRRFFN